MNLNRALWIVQVALALMFLAAGASKLVATDAMLADLYLPPPPFMRVIGVLELLGALGLILPGLLRIRPVLTPLAAAGLFVIMAGAVVTTLIKLGAGAILIPLVLAVLAAVVAYCRWRLSPLPARSDPPAGPPAESSALPHA
jgi:uncharacterized membrane protein YphA (DoxX/SURF4 family)